MTIASSEEAQALDPIEDTQRWAVTSVGTEASAADSDYGISDQQLRKLHQQHTKDSSKARCSSNSSSVQPIRKTLFEPRFDLNVLTPSWNRVAELSTTRTLMSSAEASSKASSVQRQSSTPARFCSQQERLAASPTSGTPPSVATPQRGNHLQGTTFVRRSGSTSSLSKASSKQQGPCAASVAEAVALATARVQRLVVAGKASQEPDAKDSLRGPPLEAGSPRASSCQRSARYSGRSRSASARSPSIARSEASDSEPNFDVSNFDFDTPGSAPRVGRRCPSSLATSGTPCGAAPPPAVSRRQLANHDFSSGCSVSSGFSWNSSAPRGSGCGKRPSSAARNGAGFTPSGRSSATSSTRSGIVGRPAAQSKGSSSAGCTNSVENVSLFDRSPLAMQPPSVRKHEGQASSSAARGHRVERLQSAPAKDSTSKARSPFRRPLRAGSCSPRPASVDAVSRAPAGASPEGRSSSRHPLCPHSPSQAQEVSCSLSLGASPRPVETPRHCDENIGRALARASSEATLQRNRVFGAGTAKREPSQSSCMRSPIEAWQSQAPSSARGAPLEPWQLSAKEVRQKLNRSSVLQDQGVYARAEKEQSWKVSELRLESLPDNTDERSLSRICNAFGHQVVRVNTGWDPIKCTIREGKAEVLLRSGANSGNTADLTTFLEKNLGCKVR